MSNILRITATARATALSAALLIPAAAGAFAQQSTLDQIYQPGATGAFGAQTQQQVLRAAGAGAVTPPLSVEQRRGLDKEFKTGQNNDFGANAPQPSQLIEQYSRTASTVPVVGGKRDLVGAGGQQDEYAREIYQPGSRPAGW